MKIRMDHTHWTRLRGQHKTHAKRIQKRKGTAGTVEVHEDKTNNEACIEKNGSEL